MKDYFRLKDNNTTLRAEIIGGITTFFAFAYIIFVNPNQVAAGGAAGWLAEAGADAAVMGKIWNAVYIASILAALIGTLIMALYAKLPYALACGMGLNSFFCTSFVAGAYFNGVDIIEGYHSGLVLIFVSGIIFLLLSVTGLRQHIAKAMPDCLKKAIPAGIGLFIAFIGLQNAGIVQSNQYTLLQLIDIHNGDWKTEIAPALAAFIGVILIGVFNKLKFKGSVILGIISSTVLYYVFTGESPSLDVSGVSQSFKDFAEIGITGIFDAGAWKSAFSGAHIGGVFNAVILIITFCLVDMFDTVGTLYGTAAEAGMLDENGDPVRINEAMLSDSVATVTGAVLGTSTCTTFVESAAGVAAGARTGLASVVTSVCLAICIFLSPLASVVPGAATASALIYVGVLMLKNFSKVDMDDPVSAVPAFLALVMMPLTYSISNGIGIGAIAYTVMTLLTGKFKKRDIVVSVIAVLFIFKFITVTM